MTTKSGIYSIKSQLSGRLYIGSTSNLKRRLREHKRHLINNKHGNPILQASFNKHGMGNFDFSILERCDVDNLAEREQHFIDVNGGVCGGNLFNILPNALSVLGYRHTEETKRIISQASTGRQHSDLVRLAISLGHTGKKLSEATKEKLRIVNTGKRYSEEHKKRLSVIHAGSNGYNTKLNAEKVKYMRQLKAAGINLKQLARRFGVDRSTVSDAVKRRTWSHVI